MWSRSRLTLAGQFLLLQLSVLLVVLTVAGFVTVQQADSAFRDDRGSRLRSAAENLANTGAVRSGLQERYPPEEALASYAGDVRDRLGADAVYLLDAGGRQVVGPNPTEEGEQVDVGDGSILEGRVWTGDVRERGRPSLAALVPVLSDTGDQVGIVMVAERYPGWQARLERSAPDLAVFLGLGFALGAVGSFGLSRLIKRRTRGLEPAEIGALADQREALLHSIREGLVAVADDGRITVVNDTARELLELDPAVGPGTALLDAALPPEVVAVLAAAGDVEEIRDALLVVGGRVLVVNRTRVRGGGVTGGVVVTLRDHTELLALRSEVRARESVTETLRAQTHEFANRLHTISGLLQLGEHDEAAAAIGTIVRRQAAISDRVRARVEDPQVAALLVAKSTVAAERGLAVELVGEETLPRLDADLAADVGTVLGNLVDNAVDAVAGQVAGQAGQAGDAGVRVRLWYDGAAAWVEVADSGPGVDAAERELVFERGWSSKEPVAGGRGIGLALVRQVCQRRGGEVRVGTGSPGAVFTAVLPGGRA
ncbi:MULTISPECIES: ATP-binding protein [unclassified Nocardioides]|uniref:sensor histidine kinase n=1 Tax=unclassified Nocardioides TaxID=2615069 RepID=UPI002404FC0C|nr:MULTISPECIES: ATP-binding protein [unclassified Nocardioides]MDF9714724.1 Spo0B domain-containing protein [Nocardioides sp. ChNu-99]